MKKQKGITLIALIVTIIVLIILAGISINLILGENGIITQAQRAREIQANAEVHEKDVLDGLVEQVGIETGEIIVNPYDPDGWVYAWTCTDGVWSDKIEAGNPAEGDIVAKIYETGNKIIPPPLDIGDDGEMLLEEGNEYVMVIEGQGEMGALMVVGENGIPYAWLAEIFAFMMGESDTCAIPYVSKAMICEGVTNVSAGALGGGSSLKNIVISNSVTSIGVGAFSDCISLTNVTIPDSVTSIGDFAFEYCSSLTNVTIPDSVTSIGNSAFRYCSSLTNVTIGKGVTNIGSSAFNYCNNLVNIKINNNNDETITFGNNAFGGNGTSWIGDNDEAKIYERIAENSEIYVLSQEMTTKLEGAYNPNITTVRVVTQEEMNAT